jgi:Tfp pilus assembly protein PilV
MKTMHLWQRGQTLVEAVVVVSIVVLLVTGLVAGTTASLRSAQSGRTKTQAVAIAQEGMELLRTMRDEDWDTFAAYSGSYCLGDDHVLSVSPGTCSPNVTSSQLPFTREVEFSWQDPKMVATVNVSYLEGENTRTSTLVTYFTQWK